MSETCKWTPLYEDDEPTEALSLRSQHGEWHGGEDADPVARWMKFCPYCGKSVAFVTDSEFHEWPSQEKP